MFKAYWDSAHACDLLGTYETEQEAIDAGEGWLAEQQASAVADSGEEAPELGYWVDEVEGEPVPSDDDLAAAEQAEWYAELNRGYAHDRI